MSSQEMESNKKRDLWSRLWPYLALAGLVMLFFNQMVFTDLILARGDTFLYFYPYWQMATDALRSGEIRFWNPLIFMGAPFLANSQVGLFYPPNWIFWLSADPPQAVKLAIVTHIVVGAWGMFRLAYKQLAMSIPAALFSAIVFALGGYLTAQVEHVNQLQGLVWLPWLLILVANISLKRSFMIAILFTLQILAGHTQTVFLSGIACGLWLIANAFKPNLTIKDRLVPFATLAGGAIFALFLSAVQLYPTLELTQLSSRQGGLSTSEVLSFSWHPLLATQSLLPTIGQSGFTEYVAFVPVTAFLLALSFVFLIWQSNPGRSTLLTHPALPPLLLALSGLFLALGRFNFVSWFYSRLPGLDLFRVPARWLILYAIGIALLAGFGLDQLGSGKLKRLVWPIIVFICLLFWNPISVYLGRIVPVGPESSLEYLSIASLIWLFVELVLFVVICMWRNKQTNSVGGTSLLQKSLVVGLATVSIFLASRSLPFNRLTTPEAYRDLRPASLRLQADSLNQIVPDRFLSLSEIFFDPGDQAEINSIYDGVLTEQALYDFTISIKLKEIISPNFPMVYGLASLDGFDGGILPLKSYSVVMSQTILPDGQLTTDGRLREHLNAIPDPEWLDKFNVRYVITDKVGDVWVNDVFFDRQHVVKLSPNDSVGIGYLPNFLADEIQILAEQPLGYIRLISADGESMIQPVESTETAGLWIAELPEQHIFTEIEIFAADQPVEITAISLVNSTEGWFKPVTPGQYRLIHSGDVKIYENLDVWPRATLIASGSESLINAEQLEGEVIIDLYAAEKISISVLAHKPALLVLTDAYYPGWVATVNGNEVEILELDGFLRGVELGAGEHQVVFEYLPNTFKIGGLVSLLSFFLFFISLSFVFSADRIYSQK